jgi:hypothetical protein
MKKLRLVLISLGFAISASSFAQVTIGSSDNGTTDTETSAILELETEPSAILHLKSDINDPRGFLMPRMENKERLAISSPAEGLQVYVTNFEDGTIMFFEGGKWKAFTQLSSRPGAPTNVQASLTGISGEVEITFKAPSESQNGGSAITSYTVITAYSENHSLSTTIHLDASGLVKEEDKGKGTLNASIGSITVTGLNDNTFYTFTVTATNAIGTSLPSTSSAQLQL